MRIMRSGMILTEAEHEKTPLVVRGSLPRTFLGMGLFAELALLLCGCYLLAEAVLQPLEANPVSVLGAGVMLALASVLLFYMVRPWQRQRFARREQLRRTAENAVEPVLTRYGESRQALLDALRALEEEETNLPGPM